MVTDCIQFYAIVNLDRTTLIKIKQHPQLFQKFQLSRGYTCPRLELGATARWLPVYTDRNRVAVGDSYTFILRLRFYMQG